MNRYDITNQRSGATFQTFGDTSPSRQPEYGPDAGQTFKDSATTWELSAGTSGGIITDPEDPNVNREIWLIPDSMQVVITNIDTEIAAEAQAVSDKAAALESAKSKLAALGLTEEELAALLG